MIAHVTISRIHPLLVIGIVTYCCVVISSCAGTRDRFIPDEIHWVDNDSKPTPEPEFHAPSIAWDAVHRMTFDQMTQHLDLERDLRDITGRPLQSLNINTFDEVPNSTWWTNRHFFNPLSPEEIERGSYQTGPPDTTGRWRVFRADDRGQTPEFWIMDKNDRTYMLQFDTAGNPELRTSSAAMAGRFFFAVGYNIPEEYIAWFHPESLVIDEGVTYRVDHDFERPFTREVLNGIVNRVDRQEDGRIRCLASSPVPNAKGPFSFSGTRDGDVNDWCPHEHRRELRGLRLFCALINHWDIKDASTMDRYVETDQGGYLKHYLVDFSRAFGNGAFGYQPKQPGYTNYFDLLDILVSYVSFGLHVWPWEVANDIPYSSIGYFESTFFEPDDWKPVYPLPPFENMTPRDGYWAAKIIMSFRDDHLRAVINAGKLSNSDARQYLFETLKQRQEKIGRHYFAQVNPLDHFEYAVGEYGVTISFTDLAVKYDFAAMSQSRYTLTYRGEEIITDRNLTENKVVLGLGELAAMRQSYTDGDEVENHQFRIDIETSRDGQPYSKPVRLWLWYYEDDSSFQLVGIEHLD